MSKEMSNDSAFVPQQFIDYVAANYYGVVEFDRPEWHAVRLWRAAVSALAAAPASPAAPTVPTDLSHHLRAIAKVTPEGAMSQLSVKTVLAVADEIEHYYGGMIAWKKTAEAKDVQMLARPQPLAASAVPAGWKLVPVEPTEAMIGAGIEAYQGKCEESYRAMLAASPTPAATMPDGQAVTGWQPIETAPTDGTLILLGRAEDEENDRGEISTPGRWHESDDDGPDNMGHDAGFMDVEFQEFAWGRSFGNSAYKNGGFQPTHWMPLPTAPAQQPASSEGAR